MFYRGRHAKRMSTETMLTIILSVATFTLVECLLILWFLCII